MKITDTLEITKRQNQINGWEITFNGQTVNQKAIEKAMDLQMLEVLYNTLRTTPYCNRENIVNNQSNFMEVLSQVFGETATETEQPQEPQKNPKQLCEQGLKQLINFFTEFEFTPNFRFVNTFARLLAEKQSLAEEYVYNYFRLVDNNYFNEVKAKMKSDEWKQTCSLIKELAPNSAINQRFKVYFGSAGTGKTTLAQEESQGRCVICNNSMLPSDIMEDFVFVNGQPSFQPSSFWNCMEQGLPITLDEINLLPFETLRFLQGLLDGKQEFLYKGRTVKIAQGFQVIGTMNLVVNGSVFNLPEPLVDRASEMREFKLTAKQLLNAIL
jgi:hypothetical protein